MMGVEHKPWITICCTCRKRYYYAGKWHEYDEETALRLNREPISLDNVECDKCEKNKNYLREM